MNYTNDQIAKRIQKAKIDKANLTHISGKESLTTEDKFKIGLCRHFVQYLNDERIRVTDLSLQTKIPKTRLSEITNYKIQKYTVDQLFKYLRLLAEISPRVNEYLNFLEQAVEIPAMKVSETKRLTKGLKEISTMRSESPKFHAWA